MADETPPRDAPFLKRWSQRKLAASREAATTPRAEPPASLQASSAAPSAAAAAARPATDAIVELPPVESLTFDSDFAAFLKPGVDDSLRRTALRKLFSDPRFNVMDGLDVYIDDYGKTGPIPEHLLAQLEHAKYLFNPPKTRVNALGYVEDVPDEPELDHVTASGQEPSAATASAAPAPAASADDQLRMLGDPGSAARLAVNDAAAPTPMTQPQMQPTPIATDRAANDESR